MIEISYKHEKLTQCTTLDESADGRTDGCLVIVTSHERDTRVSYTKSVFSTEYIQE